MYPRYWLFAMYVIIRIRFTLSPPKHPIVLYQRACIMKSYARHLKGTPRSLEATQSHLNDSYYTNVFFH